MNLFRPLPVSLLSLTLVLALTLTACAPSLLPAESVDETVDTTANSAVDTADTTTNAEVPAEPDTESEREGFHTFVIDPEASSASYIVGEEFFGGALSKYGIPAGRQNTVGTTQAIEGTFELNPDDLDNPLGTATFTVNLAELSSNQGLRDRWLRDNGPEFNQYPTAEFVATSIENAPDSYTEGDNAEFQLLGNMTIREITQPVTFDVTATLQDGVIAGTAIAPMKLTDFDIEPPDFANTLTVQDDFEVRVDFVANEQ